MAPVDCPYAYAAAKASEASATLFASGGASEADAIDLATIHPGDAELPIELDGSTPCKDTTLQCVACPPGTTNALEEVEGGVCPAATATASDCTAVHGDGACEPRLAFACG